MKTIKLVVVQFTLLILAACNSNKNQMESSQIESPLTIVIKLESAEAVADFSEAKKYITVEKAFANVSNDTLSPEEAWKSLVLFEFNLSKDKKFTPIFKYYKYKIKESINKTTSEVILESIDPQDTIKKIVYSLELQNDQWIVVKIDWVK